MRKILLLLMSFTCVNTFAATSNVEEDLIHYFQTSSLSSVEKELKECQKDLKILDKTIYNSGFWKEIRSIHNLGKANLTNELKIEIIGDSLQLSGAEQQPNDLYSKAKNILLSKGLTIVQDTTLKMPNDEKKYLSIFKKLNYSIKDIKININNLDIEQDRISKLAYNCSHNVLSDSVIEKLTVENNQKKLMVTNDFYNVYPELKKDKIIEKILQYQTDRYIFLNPYLQEKIIKDMSKPYKENIQDVIKNVFYGAMKEAYVKNNGVDREIKTYYYELYFWTKQLKQDINNIIIYTYDAVDYSQKQ